MKKSIAIVVLLLLAVAAGFTLYLRADMKKFEVTQITPDLHMISSEWGGNVGVLRTGEGTVIVDTMTFSMQGKVIREMAQEITGEPVVMIINSHYHLDHTHGNPAFDPGTRVVSTERTLHHLQQQDADYFSGDAAKLLPGETFSNEQVLKVGNKTIWLIQPGRGHTDGDLVALFVEDKTLHTGDLFFNKHYPNIDLEAGGSIIEWGETLEKLFGLGYDRIIPGHGTLSDASGMRQFQAFILELAELGAYAASINGSLEDTQVNGRLSADAGYVPITFGPFMSLDREFVIRRTWEEATGNFELYEGF
jgi:cyclase